MDPFTIGTIASGAGSLIGGLFGGDEFDHRAYQKQAGTNYDLWNRQMHQNQRVFDKTTRRRNLEDRKIAFNQDRAQMRQMYRNQFQWLVDGAQAAGYNPLTVLGRASTFQGPALGQPGIPPLASSPTPTTREKSGGRIGDALAGVGAAISSMDPIHRESLRLQNELTEARINQINSEQLRLGQSVPQVQRTSSQVVGGDVTESPNLQGPLLPPQHPSYPRVRVNLAGGRGEYYLAGDIAERYKIKQGNTLTAGELTEIVGEVTGEVANTLSMDTVIDSAFKAGIFTNAADRAINESGTETNKVRNPKKGGFGGNTLR